MARLPIRPRHISRRPEDQPLYTNPTGMDFEKRRLVVTSVSGTTISSMMPAISNAIVTYENEVQSYEGNVQYYL